MKERVRIIKYTYPYIFQRIQVTARGREGHRRKSSVRTGNNM